MLRVVFPVLFLLLAFLFFLLFCFGRRAVSDGDIPAVPGLKHPARSTTGAVVMSGGTARHQQQRES